MGSPCSTVHYQRTLQWMGSVALLTHLLVACLPQDRSDAIEIEAGSGASAIDTSRSNAGNSVHSSALFDLPSAVLNEHCPSAAHYRNNNYRLHQSFVSSCGSCHSDTGSAPRSLNLNALDEPLEQYQILTDYIHRFAPSNFSQFEQHALLTKAQGKSHPTIVWNAGNPKLTSAVTFVYLELNKTCDAEAALAAANEATGGSSSLTPPGVIPEGEF
jgi:hypothetical protein